MGFKTLKDYCEKIMQGITCGGEGSDKIFYVTNQNIASNRIEERLLKSVIRGRNIGKYSILVGG